MNKDMTELLAICLEKLEQNEMTLDEILDHYPEARIELEPLLRTAQTIHGQSYNTRLEFKQNSPARLLASLPPSEKTPIRQPVLQAKARIPNKLVWGLSALLSLVFVFFIGSGTVYASESSIPGDILYPVKLAVEDIRLLVASDENDMQLQMEFLQTRLDEIDQLIEENRNEDLVLAQDMYSETLDTAIEVLKKNALKENNAHDTKILEYEEYLVSQSEVIYGLIDSVPAQAQPALQSILEKTKKNKEAIDEALSETSEDNKSKPDKSDQTITPEEYLSDQTATPAPKEKSNNGKNEDKNSKSDGSEFLTNTPEPTDKVKTKNPNVPTKKTK